MQASPKGTPSSVDDYLARVSSDKRAALQRLRETIKAAIPRAEECISYQIPAFRVDGRVLVWFAAAKNHCSFFPGGIVDQFKDDLRDFKTAKGTIRFAPDHPLPATLVRKLLKARLAQRAS
ncbi:MAG: iron chaperone [Gemmatimonadaceae bacterium]